MYTKTVETWNTRQGVVTKIAVRNRQGQFHGATNFRQHSNWAPGAAGSTPARSTATVKKNKST